jgi:hypothetical protein
MKQKDFLFILIPIFILTILWVIFSIYHSYSTSTIDAPLNLQIAPIEGGFDNETLNNIVNRKRVVPVFSISDNTIVEITPLDTIDSEIATDSSNLQDEDEESTSSGEIIQ